MAKPRPDATERICNAGLRACAVAAVWVSGFDIASGSIGVGLLMLLAGVIAWLEAE